MTLDNCHISDFLYHIKELIDALLRLVMLLPIVNTWMQFLKVYLGIFDSMIALIDSHLPHITIAPDSNLQVIPSHK